MANAKISELPLLQKLGNTGAAPSSARNWDFAYTWNSGGTTFCADFMNITDTASASGSLLFDRQVGGTSKFKIDKNGFPFWGGGFNGGSAYDIYGEILGGVASQSFGSGVASTPGVTLAGGYGVLLGSAKMVRYSANAVSSSNNYDTAEGRFAAGVVEVNNGTKGNVRYLMGGGTAVASAAALPLPTGSVFHVTGTTGITSITSTNFQAGVMITLIFDGALTVTDGGNLKLAGNFVTTADDTLTLVYDGTNWYECCRSVN